MLDNCIFYKKVEFGVNRYTFCHVTQQNVYSETAGDYVLNTLLVAALVCLFVCLSVLQFSRKRLEIRSSYFAHKLPMYLSRSLLILVLISQC